MKTPHAMGLILLAVIATLAVEESRIAKLRSEIQPLAGAPAKTASASSTPSSGGDAGTASAPTKTQREPKSDKPLAKAKDEDGDFAKTARKMWDNPAGKAMMNQGMKIAVAMMYEDFIEGLSLTKEESDNLKTLLGKEMSDQQEIGMKFLNATPEERIALQAEMEKRKKENEEAVKTFLNDEEDYKNYTAYKDRLPERQQLDGIRAAMAGKNAPLDPAAEARLVDAMYAARTTADAPDYSGPKAFEEMAKGDITKNFEDGWKQQDEKLAAATKDILSETQQEAWKEFRQQSKEMQLMGIKMAEKMMNDQQGAK
ncbi:hypothetical protein [Luteolibacter sp. Populi]|uniref:hypothetical protein n=1 Tax=Luteolibacter sp. Populi TaxID=3230487 RepID=UPI003466FFE2